MSSQTAAENAAQPNAHEKASADPPKKGLSEKGSDPPGDNDPPVDSEEPRKVKCTSLWVTWIQLCSFVGFERAVIISQDMQTRWDPFQSVLLYKYTTD